MTSFTGLVLLLLANCMFAFKQEKLWTYNLLEMSSNSTNEDLCKIDVRLVRIGRGNYAMSGTVHIGIKVDSSVDEEVEVVVKRSPDGSAEYKLQPLGLPRQSLLTAMDKFYKEFLMSSVKDCSNLPQYENKMTELGPADFQMDKCKISTDAFPNYVPEGFYKLYFNGYGLADFTWYVHFQIEKR